MLFAIIVLFDFVGCLVIIFENPRLNIYDLLVAEPFKDRVDHLFR